MTHGKSFVLAACAMIGGALQPAAAQQSTARRPPNILFILADDLGYGDVGCYGQKEVKTPNIDRLASEGVRFTQCYAGSTVCAPSRCCLMTGLHTGHARVRGNALVPLKPEDVTVAEVLKSRGYATGLVGKWGLGEPGTSGVPNRQGFDEFFGFLNQHHAHNYYPEFLWKNEEKYRLDGNVEKDNIATQRVQYAPDLFTREALKSLDNHRDQPFFLYLTYTLPHANNERGRAEGNGMEVPSDAPYSDKPWPQVEKNHAAMITRLDGDIGRVLARLKELGLEDNTVVFFSSDNGPHKEGGADPRFFKSSGPLRGFKRDLYEGGIRVPMIVRWPGQITPGTVSDHVWAFWDFLPTAAELAGAEAPAKLDGLSMVRALKGDPSAPRHEFLYWEFHERGFQQAVRMGDWKTVRKPSGEIELFDLKTDLGETHDVARQHPDVVARIEQYLKTARTDSPDFPIRPAPKRSAAQARILDVRKIWDRAPHNAFTDLIRFRDRWFCVFREGKAHVAPDGALRVITSDDGREWASAALIQSPNADLRDAKISITPDHRLMLSGAGALHQPAKARHQSYVWFSDDGRSWSEAFPIGDPDYWLWRITWHKGQAYAVGYRTVEPRGLRLYRSDDGKRFEAIVPDLSHGRFPTETALAFLPDDTALCLLRQDDKPGVGQLGKARPPYTEWSWQDLNLRIGGPAVLQLPDGRLIAGCRLYDGKVRTSLCWLDPNVPKLTEILTLPSGGDTSYPGLVWHDNRLWVSYYSSHEGKTSIYFAQVELPAQESR